MVGALSVGQLFDSLAIRGGPQAWEEHLTIDWVFTDLSLTYRTSLTNGVLIQDIDPPHGSANLKVTLTKAELLGLLGGEGLGSLQTEGDAGVVARLLAVLDPVKGDFAIVTP